MFIIPQSLGQESGAAYLVPVIYAFYYQGVSRAAVISRSIVNGCNEGDGVSLPRLSYKQL